MDKLTEANLEQSTVSKQLFVSGHLPKLSISVFNGDPLQYPVWKSTFNALVDSRPLEPDIKLNLLNQHIAGKPKQVVEHYLLIGTEDAYQKARSVLQKRYRNCNVVLAARETIPELSILDYPKENVKLLGKLPYYLDVKWRNVIKQWRHANGEASYPSFLKFAEFVREAAERANIPEFEGMITPTTPKPVRNQKPKYEKNIASSLSTSGKNGVNQDLNPKEPNKQKRSGPTDSSKCLFCGQRHKLDDCQDFCKKPFSERRDLFFRERLCMGCAISKSHQVKDCKERSKCKTCSGMHPTCLHKEQSQVDVVVSSCVSVCMLPDQGGGFDHTLIILVWVRPVGQPEKEILQYAVLDDHSNVSFVSQTLCERFHLEGPSTELLLTTMQEQNARLKTSKISGLEVLNYRRECVVKMPLAFSRELFQPIGHRSQSLKLLENGNI
ncbi:uncharacterized protein [Montipora capricornis]|uniref:uncharacterized protein n=1 Tax=Montipora capricornis TaxID=246305 RepID=UPI0035F21128